MTVTSHGFKVLNEDRQFLWETAFESELDSALSKPLIGDLDGDGMPEVCFMPTGAVAPAKEESWVFVYATKGNWFLSHPVLLFSRFSITPNKYPSDEPNQRSAPQIWLADTAGGKVLITGCLRSEPARNHIRIWSADGDSLGWYVNSGACGYKLAYDYNGDGRTELFFAPTNNRIEPGGACLLVLPVTGAHGVSPPYTKGSKYDLRHVERGNQLAYVAFPPTDIGLRSPDPFNDITGITRESNGFYLITTSETDDNPTRGMRYFLRPDLRVDHVTADDVFVSTRSFGPLAKELPPVVDWDHYFQTCLESVTYWTDSGWVTEGQLRAFEKAR